MFALVPEPQQLVSRCSTLFNDLLPYIDIAPLLPNGQSHHGLEQQGTVQCTGQTYHHGYLFQQVAIQGIKLNVILDIPAKHW